MVTSRVLIADFDFFSSIGGGQVFYRRIVERNPAITFLYPSRGPDILLKRAHQLPGNVFPFAFDETPLPHSVALPNIHWTDRQFFLNFSSVVAAIQGQYFDVVDIPSFFPVAHFARPLFSAFGVTVERVAVSFLGWLSVSNRNAYSGEASADLIAALESAERQSVDAADIRYTISNVELHQKWSTDLPICEIDMHDAIETIPTPDEAPPGDGPPDLWYVGRLDGAKGPDIFVELVSRMPRNSYRGCYFTGPDNEWSTGRRWSNHLLELAKGRGVETSYVRHLSDLELRERVYRGRTVVVIPSRTDSFNYVALETTLSGCPILLSDRTGASVFLSQRHLDISPPLFSPDNIDEAATKLHDLLENYSERARVLRHTLRQKPFVRPRENFMAPIYGSESMWTPTAQAASAGLAEKLRQDIPLLHGGGRSWRPVSSATSPTVTIIIPTFNRPELLAPTLATLTSQTFKEFEVVVIDDGSDCADVVRDVVLSFAPMARLARTGNAGEAAAVNRGIAEARGDLIGILSDDDFYHPDLLAESVRTLNARPDVIGTFPDWDIVDSVGYFVEAHRLPEFDRRLMLRAHWCLPSVGTIVRRRVLEAVGGRDTTFRWVSDFDLWLRVTAHGDLAHLQRKLAYWRLHQTNLTISDRRNLMADERIRLIERLSANPTEISSPTDRKTAMAAAHLAAAAILGRASEEAKTHLERAKELDARLFENLPPNMCGYPAVWPI